MTADLHSVVDRCLIELDTLSKYLKKRKTVQVSSVEEKNIAKATALTWFNKHRLSIGPMANTSPNAQAIDRHFQELLAYTDKLTSRTKYEAAIKAARHSLRELRNDVVTFSLATPPTPTVEAAPNFAKIVTDPKMQTVLARRWNECQKCLTAEAALAATVMMGGLIEALLLAKINGLTDKAPVFTNTKAPKDGKTGKTLPLKDWGLRDYIDVSHDLKWLTISAKDVSAVIRDYRNYVHPYKELSHNVDVSTDDALLFWDISKQLVRQILK